ncbi:hypothetical protein ACLBYG_22145 [Methylobacterium sp. D53M]
MKADLAEKLSKLIPRLATDQDGEKVATVHAIQRVLNAAGLDFHDLAAELTKPSYDHAPMFDGPPFGFAWRPPKPKPASKGLNDEDGVFRPWNQVVGEILERHETIPKRYGGKFLTKEQVQKLERIYRGEIAAHDHEQMLKNIDDRLRMAWKAQEADPRRKAA